VSKARRSTGSQKNWLDAAVLAYLANFAKNASRFSPARVSLGELAAVVFAGDDPHGLMRLDEQKRVVLLEGSARRLEKLGLVIFHPHVKKIERAKSLLEVLAHVSRLDKEDGEFVA
jgi:hypothetical protein